MKVINLSEPYDHQLIEPGPVILALGFFDGVHRGHQRVIRAAKKVAQEKNAKLAVMTFDRFPKIAYQGLDPLKIRYLTTTKRKLALFEQLGADLAYVVEFNEKLVPMLPQEFVDKYIIALHAIGAVAGFDFTYGKPEIANMKTLPDYAQGRFEVFEVPELTEDAVKVGTTQIKHLLDQGKISETNLLLGYPFETTGPIVHGQARGRKLGFPTINVETDAQQKLPALGVYAVKVQIGTAWFDGMASVSHNETFGPQQEVTVEINLFDVHQDLYGQVARVQWFEYLRPSFKFTGAQALVDQMKKDESQSRELLLAVTPCESLRK
ncbi:riboflavin biosynthesis protein RibF [Ligilactobacillus salitolerans]|uniref:Riboflavin biosynthesis protein n=1 Tax=Ligilactobacillus salitolerans TaxID=1808352 RepID=A0A401IRK2_9LACO|nr:riboflavin biosynthesis protein RibF [Ligilactobacillus salitolerans]GBG94158.1 riboflavin biosynthesis protein RibF [Ligilactobacillus salitolerans]